MKTIHELRAELEQAQAAYLTADIEHPTAVSIARDNLSNARFDYWAACADFVTRIQELKPVFDPGVKMHSSAKGVNTTYDSIKGVVDIVRVELWS